jgi:hypothetical protein
MGTGGRVSNWPVPARIRGTRNGIRIRSGIRTGGGIMKCLRNQYSFQSNAEKTSVLHKGELNIRSMVCIV